MNDELLRLGEEYWDHQQRTSPTRALLLGDHRYDDRFEELSRAAEDVEIAAQRAFAARAAALDPSALDADEQVSREVLVFEATSRADRLETRLAELAVNPAIGMQALLPVQVGQFPLEEPRHARAMPAKFAEMGRAIGEASARLREGVAAGRTPLRVHAEATAALLAGQLAAPIDDDPYLRLRVPPGFSAGERAEWMATMREAVEAHVRPAWEEYRRTLVDEVAPAGRPDTTPGLCHLDGGDDAYRLMVRAHTCLDLDPAEIHRIGLDQIDALADEYRSLGAEALGTSDLDAIFTTLRDDPALRFRDGPSIVAASERALARAKAAMGDWFGRLPRADCVVRETPTGATAFYYPPAVDGSRPGTFFVNTADPTRWHTFEIEAMAYHEGIPGHHLQLAIAAELDGVPEFRKHAMVTAYAEGWGLYTERLADEMALYSGPLERIGMLSADSMRAGRLVVDTGIHALGWSRQQAIDFLAANSPLAAATIAGEVDRYIGMPGQALAYMIGRLEILEYRAEAQRQMGEHFDIAGFHDTVLGSGMVPLPTLRRLVREWAAGGRVPAV